MADPKETQAESGTPTPNTLDPVQEAQLEAAETALNREAIRHQVNEWEMDVINGAEELSVWLVHLYAQLTNKGMPYEIAFLVLSEFTKLFLQQHPGFFPKMPDIARLLLHKVPTPDTDDREDSDG